MLLGRVRRWIDVVFRQKTRCGQLDKDGRPWTRLPAKDLASQLLEQEGLDVSVRRIQRSLARLEAAGYLARQQRGIWKRDFWYSYADTEWDLQQHRPTAVAHIVTQAKEPSRRQQASPVPVENLGITSKNQNLSKTERTRATSSLDGRSPCADLQAPSAGTKGQPPRSGRIDPLQTLRRVVQRATARGFAAECLPESTVGASTDVTRWVEGGFVYERDHLGRVTKDPVATAPLR